MKTQDEDLGRQFASSCDEARAALRRHMLSRGMREADGWRIHEFTRQIEGRTELVMRPIHRTLLAPDGLECMCAIDEPGSTVSSGCHEDGSA